MSSCQHKESKPQWYRLRSPENEKQCPGIILMNLQYVNENSDLERFAKLKSVEGTFKFWGQLLNGFELAPGLPKE